MSRSSTLIAFLLIFVLVAAGAFTAGFAVAGHPALNGETWAPPVPTSTPALDPDDEDRLTVLREALVLLEAEYYDREALDSQQMIYGAIRGVISTLEDPYTSFSTPREAAIEQTDLSGKFEGIGAVVELKDDRLLIVAPQKGSPAERAGLRPGDHITHVDGRPTHGLSVIDAVALIRGPRGTQVTLTIAREGPPPEVLDVGLTREEIKLTYVSWEMLEGDIAYLRLTSFAQVTGDLVAALREIRAEQPRGIILDLRNNTGGYLEVAVDVASQFLTEGVVLYQEGRAGEQQVYEVKRGGLMKDVPMVVLVNRGSASASEIVAGALQDHERAVLVGETTFGKGSVQKIHTLSDKSSLRVTVARWITPGGREINQKGLEPDIVVAGAPVPPGDHAEDPQLQRAIDHLNAAQDRVGRLGALVGSGVGRP